jgi:DNA polymerase III epsilon subunit-like protein
MDLNHGSLWDVDVEGNGGTPPEIVQIGITEILDLTLGEHMWEWLVQPSAPIARTATRIHGISDDDVANAPTMDDIADDIMTWTDGAVIVGHNVRVEVDIIKRSIPDWNPVAAIDTLRLAKALMPGMESYGLERLGAALGHSSEAVRISGKRNHSALHDTVLTALVLIDLISHVPEERRNSVLMDADILNSRQGSLL